jgi:hypothetical protein
MPVFYPFRNTVEEAFPEPGTFAPETQIPTQDYSVPPSDSPSLTPGSDMPSDSPSLMPTRDPPAMDDSPTMVPAIGDSPSTVVTARTGDSLMPTMVPAMDSSVSSVFTPLSVVVVLLVTIYAA